MRKMWRFHGVGRQGRFEDTTYLKKNLHEDRKNTRGHWQRESEGKDQKSLGIFSYDWYDLALKVSS